MALSLSCPGWRSLPFLILALCFLTAISFPAGETIAAERDFTPSSAEELRRIADNIDENRRTGDWLGARTGIVELARAVLEGKSAGAFVLSSDRWVGAGDYLNEVLQLLSTEEQVKAVEAIDLLVDAHLRGAGEQSGTTGSKSRFYNPAQEDLLLRVARDFPRCRYAEQARAELAAIFLARGQMSSFLQFVPATTDASLRARVEEFRLAEEPLTRGDACWPPVEVQSTIRRRIPREEPLDGGYPPELRLAAWDSEFLYWFTEEGLRCVRHATGEERWFTPSLPGDLPQPQLPGNVAQPALQGALVFTTSARAITAYERSTGKIVWDLEIMKLLELSEAEQKQSSILSITPPLPSEHGILFATALQQGDRVECRLLLLSPQGEKRWQTLAGSVHGATYLALGMATIGLDAQGLNAYLLTGRGLLASYHLTDGALEWAVRYDALSNSGSEDALRQSARFLGAPLACRGDVIVGAPADSANLCIWERSSGVLRASIPRLDSKWWSWGGKSAAGPLALTGAREIQFWQIEGGKPRALGNFSLPKDFPSITGRGHGTQGAWWFPSTEGFYYVREAGKSWQFVPAPPGVAAAESIACIGENVLLGWGEEAVILRPISAERILEPDARGSLAHARQALYARNLPALNSILDTLLAKSSPGQAGVELETLLGEILQLSNPEYLNCPAASSMEVKRKAIQMFPFNERRAKACFQLALAQLAAGDLENAVAFAYRALESPTPSRVELLPDFKVPLDLAARALLAQAAHKSAGENPWEEWEKSAGAALEQAKARDTLEEYRKVATRYPETRGGRRAALESARKFFQHGNRRLAMDELQLLALTSPNSDESIEARFRVAELFRDERRFEAARRILEELVRDHGPLIVKSERGESTVAARAEQLLARIPSTNADSDPPNDATLQLLPVWRWRSELTHQRGVEVHPLGKMPALGSDSLFFSISKRSVSLSDARDGTVLWTVHFPRPAHSPELPIWADHDRLGAPLLVTERSFVLEDGETFYGLETATGALLWSAPAPSRLEKDKSVARRVIQRVVAADGVIVVLSEDLMLYGLDAQDGRQLWEAPLAGVPCGDEDEDTPQIRAGQLLIGYNDPFPAPCADLLELRTGKVLRHFEFTPGTTLVQPPWFLADDRIAVALTADSSGMLMALDAVLGGEVWRQELQRAVKRVHLESGAPFLIAEVHHRENDDPDWLLSRRELIGFAPQDGRMLWTWSSRGSRLRLNRVEYSDGDLLLLEGDFAQRRLVSLRVPPILLAPAVPSDLTHFELETQWTETLSKGPDIGRLFFHRDWILIQEPYRCDLTVLTRDGNVDRTAKFDLATHFVDDRRELYYAGFIGGTLVLITQRGSMGLRPFAPLEMVTRYWDSVRDFPFLSPPPPPGDPRSFPNEAAANCYRAGHLEESCRLLERQLEQPELPLPERQRLARELEGAAQERNEEVNLHWSVPRMAHAPVIDGALDEPWNAAATVSIRSPRYFNSMQGAHEQTGSWRGWSDLSAQLHLGWSEEGFHVALEVVDDGVYPYDREMETWRGDCLLLAFDLGDNGGTTPDDDDLLLTLALTTPKAAKPKPPAGAQPPEEEPPPEDSKPSGSYQVQRKIDGSGVIYEATLPWRTFSEHRPPENSEIPYPGMSFRMNLVVTDDDSGRGAKSYLSLSPAGQKLTEATRSVWEVFAPKYFPRIKLAP